MICPCKLRYHSARSCLVAFSFSSALLFPGAAQAQQQKASASAPSTPNSAVQALARIDDDEAAILTQQLAAISHESGSSSGSATTNDAGPAGIVPFTPGLNASLATTNQHDSTDGWQSILTPNVAYRFNQHFSANLTVPVYAYIDIYGVLSSKDASKENRPQRPTATKRASFCWAIPIWSANSKRTPSRSTTT